MALLLGSSFGPALAQSGEPPLDAERRALEAERRAVAAERRALESDQRALEAQRNASAGSSREPALTPAQACQAATSNYEFICSIPSRTAIGDDPECAAAQVEMRRRCGG
jgi:hypothetical protein